MVLASIAKLMPEAQEKGLVLDSDIKADGSYRVMGDMDQLSEHVVRNLIDNSIKYTPSGSVHVSLSKRGDKVLLSIRDTGVGITTTDKARLFTEGGRGKDSIKVNVHSTGYGLAIAKKIVDAHSGRIWSESEGAGKGSQFYVELPAGK
jgi:signal transduction histidine kinase